MVGMNKKYYGTNKRMKRLYQVVLVAAVVWGFLSFSAASSQGDSSRKTITVNNVQNLAEMAVLGQGIIKDVQWFPVGESLQPAPRWEPGSLLPILPMKWTKPWSLTCSMAAETLPSTQIAISWFLVH